MNLAARVILYVLLVSVMYCQEYDIPVSMYIKRARFLAEWKFAAWAQTKALDSYRSYIKEAEYTRG